MTDIEVFWQPGWTSCLGLKEFLSAREVDYISRDIANDPKAASRFTEIDGVRVPAVAKAGSWIPGADLGRVADFLGIAVEHRPALPVGVLVDRLCRVLATASRLTRQFPAQHLPCKLPNRDRSVLALANHIVEIAAGYLLVEAGSAFDAVVAGALPVRVLDREALDARFRAVVADLRQARPDAQREVGTFYGATSLHRVLERCTWHAAQHTRQLAFMLRRLGIEPERPLTAMDLDGLPVPQAVWDA